VALLVVLLVVAFHLLTWPWVPRIPYHWAENRGCH
jgi:hypothetical protein